MREAIYFFIGFGVFIVCLALVGYLESLTVKEVKVCENPYNLELLKCETNLSSTYHSLELAGIFLNFTMTEWKACLMELNNMTEEEWNDYMKTPEDEN